MSQPSSYDCVRRFIETLFAPDDIVEYRSIWPIKEDKKTVRQGWCRAEDLWQPDKLTLLAGFNAQGFGIYVGANPRRRHGGGKDEDVQLARALFVDFDGGCTVEDAVKRVASAGLPEPTIVLESGHGVHVYWKLDRPIEDLTLFREHQRGLIQLLGSDPAIHDPSRVMRLPGFMNTKKPAAPTWLVICEPDRVYPLARFPIPTRTEPARTQSKPGSSTRYGERALEAEVAKVLQAPVGERNTTLCRAAFKLGQLVTAGHRDEAQTYDALVRAGIGSGLPETEAKDVVGRAMAGGARCPRQRTPWVAGGPTGSLSGSAGGATATGEDEVSVTVTPSAYVPFPVNVLPEPLRSFVNEGAKAIGCDPSYIAVPLLPSLACAMGNTHTIRLKDGWEEPPILWTAIVGESGTMKTPAFKAAVKQIRRVQKLAFQKYADELRGWEIDQLRYEAELAAWKHKAKGGKAEDDPPEKPLPPTAVRYVVSDTTVEALAPILLANPRGVMLTRDEFSGWLASFDRYAKTGRPGGGDSAHWLSMHNGDSMTVDRKSGNPRTIYVPTASVSLTGGIQPGRLAAMMGAEHRESGMLARILFAQPPRRTKRWTEAVIDPRTEQKLAEVIDRLCLLKMDCSEFDSTDQFPTAIELSPEAKRLWIEFYNAHAEEADRLSGDEAAAWSKLEGYAARLTLVFHLCRWAAGDPAVPTPTTPVDQESLLAGVAMARWFGEEAMRVYETMSESEESRYDRTFEAWLRNRDGITASELAHKRREFRNNPEAARAALNRLAEAKRGEWRLEQNPNGGPSTERFWLFPAVTVTKTPPDAAGFEGFGDSDTSGGGT